MKQRSISSFLQAKTTQAATEKPPGTSTQRQSKEKPATEGPKIKRQRISEAPTTSIPVRDVQRAAKADRKLVQNDVYDATPVSNHNHTGGKTQKSGIKYTPLEQQVVELKQKPPGILLVIEVGYKFRCFGEDAENAARICNIYAFPDHNFLTCGFPVFRLPVYVPRLVNAGYKVGVVRQIETAAIKSRSSSRHAPFERKLTALYTAATLDAGQKADKAGEEGTLEAFAELDDLNYSSGPAPKYILFVAEASQKQSLRAHTQQLAHKDVDVFEILDSTDEDSADACVRLRHQMLSPEHTPLTRNVNTNTIRDEHRDAASECDVALLAVEPSTGDVQLGLVSSECSTHEAPPTTNNSRSHRTNTTTTTTAASLLALESALLPMSPEIVILQPATQTTQRMIQAYVGSSPGCRHEIVQGWGHDCPVSKVEHQLGLMYSEDTSQHLAAASQLPFHAQRLLAAATHYLGEYGLQGGMQAQAALSSGPLLSQDSAEAGANAANPQQASPAWHTPVISAGLKPFHGTHNMQLGPNALRQLEVLVATGGRL